MDAQFIALSTGDPEGFDLLKEMSQSIYLDGECYAFAIAMSGGLGWQIVGLVIDEVGTAGIIRHAGVRMGDGRVLDVRGPQSERDFAAHFVRDGYGWRIRDISEEELRLVRPIEDRSILMARRLAEKLWPSLPWRSTETARVQAFVKALTDLCRQHGQILRGAVPASPPIIYPCEPDDEIGFTVEETAMPGQFLLRRTLETR